jgi:hypothetical protein
MTHGKFVSAYARGEIRVERSQRARTCGALLLPFVMMPVVGLGIALALIGWFFLGLAVIALGIIVPQLIKRSAPHFLLTQVLEDGAVYEEVTRSGLLRVTPVSRVPSPSAGGEG